MAKYIQISKNFINCFATEQDMKDLNLNRPITDERKIPLSIKYPTIVVTPLFATQINSLLNDEKSSDSYLFRKIIGIILPDHSEWATRKGSQMLRDFEIAILAAFGKFFNQI